MAELYTDKIRAFASSLASATNWLGCFVITFPFDYLVDGINYQGVMWLYAAFGFCLFVFTIFMLPETKGKTFEEIKAYFDNRNKSDSNEVPKVDSRASLGDAALSTLRSTLPEAGARA
jgi:SP family facilitated glucose transporter-like MFS transporter 8